MPLENTGKIITKININKDHVSIYFGSERLSLSKDSYSLYSSILYKGNLLSSEEYFKLKRSSDILKELKYLLSLFKVRHYSECEIKNKLFKRNVDKATIEYLLSWLKQYDLLDDYMLGMDLYYYYNEKNYGKTYILNKLELKGINTKKIDEIKFNVEDELAKAITWIDQLLNKYNKYPFNKRKKAVFNSLKRLGFEDKVCFKALDGIKSGDDSSLIIKDLEKLYDKHSKSYKGLELKNKIIKSLINKGYIYEDIKGVIDNYDY